MSVYVYLSIFLSFCLPIYLSFHLSIYICLSIYRSISLPISLTIYLSIYLSFFFLSFFLSFYVSIGQSIPIYLYLTLSLNLSTVIQLFFIYLTTPVGLKHPTLPPKGYGILFFFNVGEVFGPCLCWPEQLCHLLTCVQQTSIVCMERRICFLTQIIPNWCGWVGEETGIPF